MNRWQQLCERFAALQMREQLLIAGAAIVVTLALCDWLLWSPLRIDNSQLERQIASAQTQAQALLSEQQQIQQQLKVDPNAEVSAQIEMIRKRIAEQDAELAQLTVDLIPPDAMATVLREVLGKRKELKLVALANIPAQPAFSPTEEAAPTAQSENEEAAAAPIIYKHGLTLTLRGNYFEVLDYLRALAEPDVEKRRFFWESIDYKVDKYPQAEVTLKVYTLGNKEAWIGA